MGLIQNIIEGMGVATIALTVHPHITKNVGVPRAVAMRYPQGNPVGEPHNTEQQTNILVSTLHVMPTIQEPNTILEWPFRWRGRRA